MTPIKLALSAAILAATGAMAFAQPAPQPGAPGPAPQRDRPRMSADDIAAFTDARIASLKAGLKLNPEQEKLWPAFETVLREQAKARADRAAARRAEWASRATPQAGERPLADPVARMRDAAQATAARAAELSRLADAAEPLVKSLDESQKRRFNALLRAGGEGWRGGWRR